MSFGFPDLYVRTFVGLIHGIFSLSYLCCFVTFWVLEVYWCSVSFNNKDDDDKRRRILFAISGICGIISAWTAYFHLPIQSFFLSKSKETQFTVNEIREHQYCRVRSMFVHSYILFRNNCNIDNLYNLYSIPDIFILFLIGFNSYKMYKCHLKPKMISKGGISFFYAIIMSVLLLMYGLKHVPYLSIISRILFNTNKYKESTLMNVKMVISYDCLIYGFIIEWGFFMYYLYGRNIINIDQLRQSCTIVHSACAVLCYFIILFNLFLSDTATWHEFEQYKSLILFWILFAPYLWQETLITFGRIEKLLKPPQL